MKKLDKARVIQYLSRDNVWVSLPQEWVEAFNKGTIKSIRDRKKEKGD